MPELIHKSPAAKKAVNKSVINNNASGDIQLKEKAKEFIQRACDIGFIEAFLFDETIKYNDKYPDPVGKFEIENGVLIEGFPDDNGDCIIPYGVTCIGEKAFAHIYTREKIKSVTIPDTVTSINDSVFRWCQKLETINWGKSVINIGKNAFQDCHNLTIVVIPDSVRSIGECAFDYCRNLVTLVVPDTVRSIGTYAFANCNNLSNVTLPANESFKKIAFDPEMRKRLGYT